MSTPMTAADWLAALKREGITRIVEMPEWKTHNRNHRGAWGEVHGALIHHTAGVGPGMAEFCHRGTTSLPGPLCHDFLSKDGTLYLVGNGRTNHAGTIAANSRDAIHSETLSLSKTFTPDAAEPYDGNRELYGLEIENKGDGHDPYPPGQYDIAVRWAAARCRFHGWAAGSVAGHREVTRRKIDPSFSMGQFRRDVAARLTSSPTAPPKDDDMDALDVWGYRNAKENAASIKAGKGPIPDAYKHLRDTDSHVVQLTTLVRNLSAKVDALTAAIKAQG